MGLRSALLPLVPLLTAATASAATPQDPEPTATPTVTIPAFTGYAHPDPTAILRNTKYGKVSRCNGQLVFYLYVQTPGTIAIRLHRTLTSEPGPINMRFTLDTHPGDDGPSVTNDVPPNQTTTDLGQLDVTTPGYYRLTLSNTDSSPLRGIDALELSGTAVENLRTVTIERRNAASVHLGYDVPRAHRDDIEWFYAEITPRTDPLWTYYMATGWSRGYFGMQVNSPTERRIIFSVWDSGNEAVDRSKVAAEDRVQLIAKGENVHASGFGNEGTGGHSHLVHDWRLGDTFKFLVNATTDGTHTTYTGWFWFAERNQWGLIASFRAPKDGHHLRSLYSFNENFSGANGDKLRDCEFGNLWARTTTGEWLPLRTARFTTDGHGKQHRFDRSAGTRDGRFYLQNGGFVTESTRAGTRLTLPDAIARDDPPAELPTPPTKPGKAPR